VSHIHASTSTLGRPASNPQWLTRLVSESSTVFGALFNSGALVREVEAMGKLLQRAHRLDAVDPAAAAQLRRKASSMLR
jgi:hypothetical protein